MNPSVRTCWDRALKVKERGSKQAYSYLIQTLQAVRQVLVVAEVFRELQQQRLQRVLNLLLAGQLLDVLMLLFGLHLIGRLEEVLQQHSERYLS